MATEHPGYRIFVLGAGFSNLAGLPLAAELFSEIRSRIEMRHGRETKFQRDIDTTKADFYLNGFSKDAVDFIFSKSRS